MCVCVFFVGKWGGKVRWESGKGKKRGGGGTGVGDLCMYVSIRVIM